MLLSFRKQVALRIPGFEKCPFGGRGEKKYYKKADGSSNQHSSSEEEAHVHCQLQSIVVPSVQS
jgi:hypothetical protein